MVGCDEFAVEVYRTRLILARPRHRSTRASPLDRDPDTNAQRCRSIVAITIERKVAESHEQPCLKCDDTVSDNKWLRFVYLPAGEIQRLLQQIVKKVETGIYVQHENAVLCTFAY